MSDLNLPRKRTSNRLKSASRYKRPRGGLGRHRSYRREKRVGWVRWLIRLFVVICILSALPMLILRFVDPPTTMFIELNKANNNKNIKQEWLALNDISAYFPLAVIASEDQRFPYHRGIDWNEIRKVLVNSDNGLSRGASTLTQQTVKNLFLWPGRNLFRKSLEAWLALWMELIVPKRRILELYVNVAQFGKSIFGVGAASQHYFGITADQLNAQQSALIAASLPTPSRSNPAKPSKYLLERAAFIQDQMPRVGGRRLIREL